jgi:3-methyladenine DNA glycosylase AlkC
MDLKSFYDRRVIAAIGRDLGSVHRGFAVDEFVADCLDGLEELELMGRAWHIAGVMQRRLPENFAEAADVVVRSLPAEDAARDEWGGSMDSFRFLPHVLFVSKFGLQHFEESMRAFYELTKRFTSEFGVRAFFDQHPEATHARFVEWAGDSNVHVRRLVSEGSRPRLPWASRLRAFERDPAPVIALLELLKDDPEIYVRRSVANNLNDIAKDHPEVAVAVCRRWARKKERLWIVRHALRSLVKQGHPGALEILGFGAAPKVRVAHVVFEPERVEIGGKLRVSFELVSEAKQEQTLLVDYAVHYVKANGGTAAKVFKISSVKLGAKGVVRLGASLSFREMTTRKHYAGVHRIEVLVNGVAMPLGAVEVVLPYT